MQSVPDQSAFNLLGKEERIKLVRSMVEPQCFAATGESAVAF
jgi:hypothetical protein